MTTAIEPAAGRARRASASTAAASSSVCATERVEKRGYTCCGPGRSVFTLPSHQTNWFGSASIRFIAGVVSGPRARASPCSGAMTTARATSARSCAAQAAIVPPMQSPTTTTLSPRPRATSTASSVARRIAARVEARVQRGHAVGQAVPGQARDVDVRAALVQTLAQRAELLRAVREAVQQHHGPRGAGPVRHQARAALGGDRPRRPGPRPPRRAAAPPP